jgi:hypothetical protein
MQFYARQLPGVRERKYFPEPAGFWAGSVAVNRGGEAVVRTADYYIEPNGGWYRWRGSKVTTRNFRSTYNFHSRTFSGFEEIANPPPLRDAEVVGLEDVRLYDDTFTATQKQWTPEGSDNLMVVGKLGGSFAVIRSPDQKCQKNWLPLPDARLLYKWKPLTIAGTKDNELVVHEEHDSTPPWFALLRGSAPPFRVEGRWIALAHVVAPTAPRQYFSVLVELEEPAWRPVACSLPFYFIEVGVEYCLSAQAYRDEIHFFVSRMDRESYVVVSRASDVLAALTIKT